MTASRLAALGLGTALGWLAARPRRRFSFRGRTVVISGGSRGLGLCIARELAAEQAFLVLLARDPEELQRAATELRASGAQVLEVPCDVGDPDDVQRAMQQALERFGTIDALFNVAGRIFVAPLEHQTPNDFRAALRVHLWGPLHTTFAVLPHMRRRKSGCIVNVSSIGGVMPVPHLAAYCTSKFALTGFSETLRTEVRRHGVHVTTVCPGLMRTGSPPHAEFAGKYRREHAWFATSAVMPLLSMDAQRAARRIVDAAQRGQPMLILGAPAKLAALAHALCPSTALRVGSLVNRLLPGRGADRKHRGDRIRRPRVPHAAEAAVQRAAARNNEVGDVT